MRILFLLITVVKWILGLPARDIVAEGETRAMGVSEKGRRGEFEMNVDAPTHTMERMRIGVVFQDSQGTLMKLLRRP
ncbi:hypothetical protein E5676_scaffold318G00440 [Cucumis melo var. makuwa]|uniref:Uncharacterized protein n=1 Tax=Cucumis melo var. makuwa TaxID=1194695 RepID=A0A5D3DEU7_CUCMM|nr:hypothetical protein E6C27_scaffold22G00950 [Cucumis melo var. makuwa]TYK22063.1 hypothetical protein E5676_scaffold318G00440 [Cucumis melo var. makuwa]